MPKPWARYEIGFITHRKFLALNANAICLWIEGKDYADATHTDGLLPKDAVRHFRFYSKKAVALLMTSAGAKDATTGTVYAPLWATHDLGWKMHDYLEHNDCREVVLARLAAAEDKKQKDRDQKAAWRAAKAAKVDCPTGQQTGQPTGQLGGQVPDAEGDRPRTIDVVREKSGSYQKQNTDPDPERTLSLSAREKVITDEDLGDRARELLEAYVEWYRQERHGARLRLLHNTLEFQDACDLCRHWDDAHLAKLAKIVLTTNDPYISGTDRGFKIFALKATWADDRLREWEQKNGVAV